MIEACDFAHILGILLGIFLAIAPMAAIHNLIKLVQVTKWPPVTNVAAIL